MAKEGLGNVIEGRCGFLGTGSLNEHRPESARIRYTDLHRSLALFLSFVFADHRVHGYTVDVRNTVLDRSLIILIAF